MKSVSKLLLVAFLSSSLFSSAQNIQWSEQVKKGGRNSTVFYDKNGDFYVTDFKTPNYYRGYQLNYYSNLQNFATVPLNSIVLVDKYDFSRVIMGRDKLTLITIKVDDVIAHVNRYFFSKNCQLIGDKSEIMNFQVKKAKSLKDFNCIQSENKEFVCIEYTISGEKGEFDTRRYKLFNSNFEVLHEGSLDIELEKNEFEITNRFVSNQGEYFTCYKVFEKNEKGKIKDENLLESFNMFYCKDTGIDKFNLTNETERPINELAITTNENGVVSFVSTYGNSAVVSEGFCLFQIEGEDFKKTISPFKSNVNSTDDKPRVHINYKLIAAHYDTKGDLLIAYEKKYLRITYSTDSKGNTKAYNNYFSQDIYFCKLNTQGEVLWENYVVKNQRSVNDEGFTNSIAGYFTDDKFVFVFNDNKDNYDENGICNKTSTKEMEYYMILKKTSGVAKVEMDLSNGTFTRELIRQDEEGRFYLIPSECAVDYESKKMLMYFRIMKKEKFGLLSF